MNANQANAMIQQAVSKTRGAPVGAYLTLNHPDSETGFCFVMVGPKGEAHELLGAVTNQERLDAHWSGFVQNLGDAFSVANSSVH